MIAILDYGMGNLYSVKNALDKIGAEAIITKDRDLIHQAKGLILPGVGAFDECMENLKKSGLVEVITQEVKEKPLLGICLGMQVLFEKGYEGQECKGLGLLQGEVVLMEDEHCRIPHVGWNNLVLHHTDSLTPITEDVYFVHSYYAQKVKPENCIATVRYGHLEIPAYVREGNILGMQYHPEKSGKAGLAMLERFKEMCL